MFQVSGIMKSRRGSELLLTLLITTAALAAALNLAIAVLAGLGGATLSASSQRLYYVAESGVERALYRTRKLRIPPPELGMGVGTNCDCGGSCPAIAGCELTDVYPTSPTLTFVPLEQDQSEQVDIFDTQTTLPGRCASDTVSGSLSTAACVDELEINCRDASGTNPQGSVVVTVTKVGDGNVWGGMQGTTLQQVYDCPLNSTSANSFSGLNTGASYVVKLRAIRSDVNISAFRARNSNVTQPVASRVELTGRAGNFISSQEIKVSVPNRPAVLGLLDQVIYSECGINKKNPLSLPADQPCP